VILGVALVLLTGAVGPTLARAPVLRDTRPLRGQTPRSQTLRGSVESNGTGLPGYDVSLYATFAGAPPRWTLLGSSPTSPSGGFEITYQLPTGPPHAVPHVLFVLAENGPAMLAAAVGLGPTAAGAAVVNERTTVATGTAFAQFVDGARILGNTFGMVNAIQMAANLADPRTGEIGQVLGSPPNGDSTSTLRKFNSLANIVAGCVADANDCAALLAATTPTGGPAPTTVLQAVANMAKDPSFNADALLALSKAHVVYLPAWDDLVPLDSWALFLRFGDEPGDKGAGNVMNGPGNFAIDRRGFLWVNDNYEPEAPLRPACAGLRLLKFYPWGESFPGSPYFGGGLSGAGYGITLDPHGNVWVGNFGFEAPECANPNVPPFPDPARKIPATHDSVSKFTPDGRPISGKDGYRVGGISWPQATVSDKRGTIWVANCGNDSVTLIPKGNRRRAFNVDLQPPPGNPGAQLIKPFGLALDLDGNAWVAGNKSETLSVIAPDGTLIEALDGKDGDGNQVVFRPMAVAADSHGNMWVANSDTVDVPCPPPSDVTGVGPNASIALYLASDRQPYSLPFTGGGITIPWGISVDGNDTVWVANFGITAPTEDEPPSDLLPRVSHFCGIDTARCPARARAVGAPISPDNGYTSDALQRNTTTAIDPSGNVWLTNNWRQVPPKLNPGGNSIVVVIGVAAPIKTPLIGPPVPFAMP
jgi:hypothetical protein